MNQLQVMKANDKLKLKIIQFNYIIDIKLLYELWNNRFDLSTLKIMLLNSWLKHILCNQKNKTTIQGSASDLVKSAMISVDRVILNKFNRISAKLVLQMHDELMYEVLEKDANQFAILLRRTMESCSSELTVQLPVKVKIGQNWGSMEYQDQDK